MELVYAMLATYGEYTPDGKLNMIGGDFDTLTAAELPLVMPNLHVIAKIAVRPEEVGGTLTITTVVIDPHGVPLMPQVHGVFAPPAAADPETPPPAALAIGFQQFPFGEYGTYRVRLSVNDTILREMPLHVRPLPQVSPGERESLP